ncbi:NIPSNAP family protein [Flavihumibacter petaseus]|uniref:NIPSNAP domain-containing protein n=1 Tax=Flavihumibacter petaseus NBRC 106054 TaxID=1220578 RepID=A0A0E9MW37_9BACT|nr:NIPSNAP family protein [Flavihumibacter petaseus]GAO41340.1 hypothetical protein FPE01S_01_03520 [Flavihumibacter petaseus NBRC 106054]
MHTVYRKIILAVLFLFSIAVVAAQHSGKELLLLRVYHFQEDRQEKLLDQYLQDQLLPMLHRQSVKTVGAFKAIANDTAADKKIFVLMPLKDARHFQQLSLKAFRDTTNYSSVPFTRVETILLEAFDLAPKLSTPAGLSQNRSEHIYELRSYESASDMAFRNKVKMFNEGGEIALFARLGFNAVFYGSVIAGSHMPNLMYMTSFNSIQDREAHWKTFGGDAEWKTLSSLPEYQNNVSHMDIYLLKATTYSDF